MAESYVAALIAALGDAVSVAESALAPATTDRSGHRSGGLPGALVTARSIADVQTTMRIATEFTVPVVVRGAGTGLAGGAIAGPGEIVISTLAMNEVLEVSVADELAVVQPGIINGDLNAKLAEYGMWFAPDPASYAISTIGGNIATNAGGLLCAKYGVTREAVLGLTVVLADGTLLKLGHRSVKGVTGLDLTALMIGSEGTLGVIVEATLKLRPVRVGQIATISAWFDDVTSAAIASAAVTAAGVRPAAMELLDELALKAIAAYLSLDTPGGSMLLVQTDGPGSAAEAERAMEVIRSAGGRAESTTNTAEGERLFAIRRAFNPALEAQGSVLIEDVAVPRSAMPAMFAAIAEISARTGIPIPTAAHAGDGNLHPNFVYTPESDGSVPATIWAAAAELFTTALRLGGTLTGEHGVGILKRHWLEDELGVDQLALQRQIKNVFDPLGIMNPGKAY